MTEEAARVADGGLSNASRSCAGRDPTKDAALCELGGDECGSVLSRRDGRTVVALWCVWGPRTPDAHQQTKFCRGRACCIPDAYMSLLEPWQEPC